MYLYIHISLLGLVKPCGDPSKLPRAATSGNRPLWGGHAPDGPGLNACRARSWGTGGSPAWSWRSGREDPLSSDLQVKDFSMCTVSLPQSFSGLLVRRSHKGVDRTCKTSVQLLACGAWLGCQDVCTACNSTPGISEMAAARVHFGTFVALRLVAQPTVSSFSMSAKPAADGLGLGC